jgi:DNA modification methylase
MLWMYKPNDETFPWRGWLMKSEAILVSSKGKGHWSEIHPFAHDCYTANWSTETRAALQDTDWHASIKPMPVMVDIITRVSAASGLLYDPFLGSGTTLIAAERTNRRCYGMEIEPRYCDVVLRRAEAEAISPIERVG